VFVDAAIDDPSTQGLAARLPFQYIPTSFFVSSKGKVVDSLTGPMSETEMKKRLDSLVSP
jgi:thioredoxin-like negative regulator of GroEL